MKTSFQTLMDWVLMYLGTLRPVEQPEDVKLYVIDELNQKKYPVVTGVQTCALPLEEDPA